MRFFFMCLKQFIWVLTLRILSLTFLCPPRHTNMCCRVFAVRLSVWLCCECLHLILVPILLRRTVTWTVEEEYRPTDECVPLGAERFQRCVHAEEKPPWQRRQVTWLKDRHTLRSLQAFGDTLQGEAVAPEGQYRAVGTSRPEEVRLSAVEDIVIWGERERHQHTLMYSLWTQQKCLPPH